MHSEFSSEGESWPSVTTILDAQPKPWLERWYCKWGRLADYKTRAASNIGTAFHKCVETNTRLPDNARVDKMFNNFVNWADTIGLCIKEKELHVVSDIYHYHGTFDATGTLGKSKELLIFDWKTSSAIYSDMALQMSAYAQAYFEQSGIRVKRGIIVHVSKDKPLHKLTVKEYTLGPRLFKKFLKRLNEYREMKEAGV